MIALHLRELWAAPSFGAELAACYTRRVGDYCNVVAVLQLADVTWFASLARALLALAEVQDGMAPSLCAARLFFTIWVATIHASSELDELLVMATVQNDPDAVGEFLEAGVDADAISERGVTVLMLASMMGHTEVAKHLLGRGAKTEAADDLGNRALMLAASYGKLELLNLLLDAGAEVDARNKQGLTALMLATVEGQPSAARILMDKGGATLDAADREGNQALMIAARKGDPDLTRLLLLFGAATEAKNDLGMTALMVAVSMVHAEEVDSMGQLAVVRMLLVAKADIEAEDHAGGTPLMIAAAAGSAPLVRLLLEEGAKVDAVDSRGLSAMEIALRGSHDECAMVLRDALDDGRVLNAGRRRTEKEEV